jgi:hypothetical protein
VVVGGSKEQSSVMSPRTREVVEEVVAAKVVVREPAVV